MNSAEMSCRSNESRSTTVINNKNVYTNRSQDICKNALNILSTMGL